MVFHGGANIVTWENDTRGVLGDHAVVSPDGACRLACETEVERRCSLSRQLMDTFTDVRRSEPAPRARHGFTLVMDAGASVPARTSLRPRAPLADTLGLVRVQWTHGVSVHHLNQPSVVL